eukprot:2474347-Rhodomonas_salina.2
MPYDATCLRACYAMPSTEMSYDAICLRTSYAIPDTETARGIWFHQEEVTRRMVAFLQQCLACAMQCARC